jgi:hypothetical protein
LGDRAEFDSSGELEWDVFHAVDCDVNAAGEQRIIDFFCKQALTAYFRKWNIQDFVSRGFDGNEFHRNAWPLSFKFGLHPVRLPQCEGTGTRPNAKGGH